MPSKNYPSETRITVPPCPPPELSFSDAPILVAATLAFVYCRGHFSQSLTVLAAIVHLRASLLSKDSFDATFREIGLCHRA
jgi:hypothetical protein